MRAGGPQTGWAAEVASGTSAGDLVRAAQGGDARAFEQIYRQHVGRVYALCLRMVADPQHAEVLTQDAFVRAWEKLGTYRGQGSFGGWLHRLTANLVIEDRRRAARTAAWFTSDETAGAQAAARPRSIEDAISLERAIATLPPGARAAFVLHDVEGYRHDEIAKMIGVASPTVRTQLHRARSLLRQALQGTRKEATR
jgi:RNA polymerase sigma-70 factor (ECF subfamily)